MQRERHAVQDGHARLKISDAISEKDNWTEIQRTLPLRNHEMQLTLMLDSIRGSNDFSYWWGQPRLMA